MNAVYSIDMFSAKVMMGRFLSKVLRLLPKLKSSQLNEQLKLFKDIHKGFFFFFRIKQTFGYFGMEIVF